MPTGGGGPPPPPPPPPPPGPPPSSFNHSAAPPPSGGGAPPSSAPKPQPEPAADDPRSDLLQAIRQGRTLQETDQYKMDLFLMSIYITMNFIST